MSVPDMYREASFGLGAGKLIIILWLFYHLLCRGFFQELYCLWDVL